MDALSDLVLIFIHIPRTGGTTIRTIVEKQYADDEVLSLYGNDITDAVAVTRDFCKDQEALSRLKLVRGHVTFGLHEYIPRPCAYFTVLRDPVYRALSLYKYIRRDPAHFAYQEGSKMTVGEFVLSGIVLETNNGQVRQLCGSEGALPQKSYGTTKTPYGECPDSMLREAVDNVSNYFIAVGVLERFDGFIQYVNGVLGWKPVEYRKTNATKEHPSVADLELQTRADIGRLNRLDYQLYQIITGGKQ